MEIKIAAVYLRVSTEDQTEYSPDAQLAAIRSYAASNGYDIDPAHIYRDDGISGRSAAKRPGFQAMIAAARRKDHPFSVILVHKLDRFARSREDSVVYKSLLLRECGVRVVSITEPITDDKTSILIEPLLEAMAEYYSVNLGEEVKKGMRQKALQGGLQSTPSFGYRAEGGQLVPDAEEAAIVREIFRRFVAGEGLYPLARWLNDTGIRTKRGGRWENRTVEYLLRNPVYIGKLRWNPARKTRRRYDDPDIIIADATHERLIDDETWKAAQQRMAEVKARWAWHAKPAGDRKHWLCGLMRCAACGATLVAVKGKYGTYVKCNNYVRGKCRSSQHYPLREIERAVLERMTADAESAEPIRCRVVRQQTADTAGLRQAISAAERRLARAKDAYLAGVDTLEEYRAVKAAEDQKIADLQKQIDASGADDQDGGAMRQRLVDALAVLRDPAASVADKYTAASGVIDAVVFDKGAGALDVAYRIFL